MKASVLMITYNHEKFISRALDSILMQKANFDYEIIVGEDCSKDGTREILLDYRNRYPDRIHLLFSDSNVGMLRNYVRTFRACRGEYIAVLDGDDYWTSPDKLQKQVDYLDSHPECSMCFHTVHGLYEDSGKTFVMAPHYKKETYELEDLLGMNFIMNSSVVYRAGIITDFPAWWYSVEMTDWTTHILHAQHGRVGFIDEDMAIYRIHSQGVWSMQSDMERIQGNIKVYDLINKHLNHAYDKRLRALMSNGYHKLSLLSYEAGDLEYAKTYATRCFAIYPFNRSISRSVQLKTLIQFKLIWLFKQLKTYVLPS